MPKQPIQRSGRQRRSVNQGLKKLVGRGVYFPVRTGRRQGVGPVAEEFPEPPPTWMGTLPEWAIYWAHTVLDLVEWRDFVYQFRVGEREAIGTAVLDFYEIDLGIGINIQGTFWHYGFGGYKIMSDMAQKVWLESRGIQVIFIDEDAATSAPLYYLREARDGRDHSLLARGLS